MSLYFHSGKLHPFSTANEVVIGQGYPKEYKSGNGWETKALLYAHGSTGNQLCANSINRVDEASRKKRVTVPGMNFWIYLLESKRKLNYFNLDFVCHFDSAYQ